MDKFEVIEDNGGGLTLFVFDNEGKIKYAHTGYEYNNGQLLSDLDVLKRGEYPVSEWDGDFEDDEDTEITDRELYDDLVNDPTVSVICDNDGIYYSEMGFAGWEEFKDNAVTIAAMIRTSETWIPDLNYELCKLAGLADEYEKADGDSFEGVVYKAAEMLNVEI